MPTRNTPSVTEIQRALHVAVQIVDAELPLPAAGMAALDPMAAADLRAMRVRAMPLIMRELLDNDWVMDPIVPPEAEGASGHGQR